MPTFTFSKSTANAGNEPLTIMKTRLLPVILCLLLWTPVGAANDTLWSLQRCIDHALRHNLELKQQELLQERVRADVTQSYANMFPSLSGNSSQGYQYGRSVDPFTNEFVTEGVFSHNMSATSDVMIFSGFNNVNNIRYHLARSTAVRYDTQRAKNDLMLTIAGAYLQILYHLEMLAVTSEQTEVTGEQLNRSRILFEGGTISRGALLEVESQHARQQLLLQQAENNLRLSTLELIQLLDLDPEVPFSVEHMELDVSETFAFQDPARLVEQAMGIEPSVQAASFRVMMSERSLSMARGLNSPRLAFQATVRTGYSEASRIMVDNIPEIKPYNDQIRDNFSTGLFLNLSIPVLNRFQTRTRISQSRIDLESSQIAYEQRQNSLRRLIYQSHADALAAWQQYLATERSKASFEESFRFAQQRFDQGMITAVEYNEARVRLAQSQADALQARYQYVFMVKILEFYQGMGLQF
jgi:outer membrane protein